MDIGNALRRTGREDIAIRSVIANTISDLYPRKIEIKSVKIHGNKVIIRTDSSIVNSELSLISDTIKKDSLKKLSSMGIKLSDSVVFRFT